MRLRPLLNLLIGHLHVDDEFAVADGFFYEMKADHFVLFDEQQLFADILGGQLEQLDLTSLGQAEKQRRSIFSMNWINGRNIVGIKERLRVHGVFDVAFRRLKCMRPLFWEKRRCLHVKTVSLCGGFRGVLTPE